MRHRRRKVSALSLALTKHMKGGVTSLNPRVRGINALSGAATKGSGGAAFFRY